jgi:hypothetical protein
MNKKARNAQARRRAKLAMPARRIGKSCCLAIYNRAIGSADESPIDVRPEFFAAHGAMSQTFNRDAMLERHSTIEPLAYCPRRNTKRRRKRALASEDLAGLFYSVHAANLAPLTMNVNSPANYFFI